ncbi:hypothetical protein Sjap_003569 [Stephania japonica]|uniref:Uncharacterized protein n=1 Tax=Stephania japonica TaxID=461633 RepID=A0AAP0KRF5_9MAGN
MSFLAYPDPNTARNLHVWNNLAFDDDDETEESEQSLNGSDSFDSNSGKENRRPHFGESSRVNLAEAICDGEKFRGKPLRLLFEKGLIEPFVEISDNEDQIDRSEGEIDCEMREIAVEIRRLALKFEALRLVKEGKALMNHSEGIGLGAPENTPIQSAQTLQDGAFKVSEIDGEKVTMRRGGRSLSPMKHWSSLNMKRGFATVGPKQLVRNNNNGVLTSIKPKNLFVANATIKKQVQRRRVVASRYNQIPARFCGSNGVGVDQIKRSCRENKVEKKNRINATRCGSLVAKLDESEEFSA